jgi:hypothetical protein
MPKIIETSVFCFDELSDGAKEKARDWYRANWNDYDWYEFIYEDFEMICAILGVTLRMRSVRLMGGGTRGQSCIYFSGFWSQGDGACFEGEYAYAKQALKRLKDHAPQDETLHDIARRLDAIQRRNFYQLEANIRHQGRYYHEYTMSIDVERRSQNYQDMTKDAEDMIVEAMRDLARWLYRKLECEWDYQTPDEIVDDTIRANEYTFTENGRRFG